MRAGIIADKIKQRLLCTYNGPGTEWLENSNVNRHGLSSGRNEKIVKDQSLIKRANAFDILILRGEKFTDEVFQGAVHRSPPIELTNTKRIIL